VYLYIILFYIRVLCMRARAWVSFTPSPVAAVLLLLFLVVVVVEGHCRRRRRRLCPAREFVYSGCTRSTTSRRRHAFVRTLSRRQNVSRARAYTMVRRGRDWSNSYSFIAIFFSFSFYPYIKSVPFFFFVFHQQVESWSTTLDDSPARIIRGYSAAQLKYYVTLHPRAG